MGTHADALQGRLRIFNNKYKPKLIELANLLDAGPNPIGFQYTHTKISGGLALEEPGSIKASDAIKTVMNYITSPKPDQYRKGEKGEGIMDMARPVYEDHGDIRYLLLDIEWILKDLRGAKNTKIRESVGAFFEGDLGRENGSNFLSHLVEDIAAAQAQEQSPQKQKKGR